MKVVIKKNRNQFENWKKLFLEDARETAEEFASRILELESNVYDLSYVVRQKDFEINELTIAVNDLRGKFVKPTLKKVSKTQGKFDKLKSQKEVKTQKVDLRQNLKNVEKNTFKLDDEVITFFVHFLSKYSNSILY